MAIVAGSLLAGAFLSDRALLPYLSFPPPPPPRHAVPFSWPAFWLIAVSATICVGPFLIRIISSAGSTEPRATATARFPSWGWLGVIVMLTFWVLAWNRFPWFEPFQAHTFAPLWLGYIVTVNALTARRTRGQCMLTNRTRYFLALFPLSAIFWWSFEFINRFIGNWYYVGVQEFGGWHYLLFTSISFSTVLPAVLSTAEWLQSFPLLSAGLERFVRLTVPRFRLLPGLLMIASVFGFIALAIWPQPLFFLAWLMPLLLILALQACVGEWQTLVDLAAGDWRRLWLLALAGLICGLFWEMWNAKSLAHWEYAVPYVQHFEIFKMPVLGYAGYIPFGILCGLFADFIMGQPKPLKGAGMQSRMAADNAGTAFGA